MKKDGVVTTAAKGSAPKDETVMIVSGRNVYDAFGRVAKAYYPVTEAVGSKTTFNKAFDNVSPTVTVYDVLDRAMKVTLPDNAETKTEYSTDAGSNALVTTVTDALGNRQATYTDGSGKTVKTEQLSGPDGIITTSFEYDGIDRLVKVTDTEGNVTTSVYDMGDRRTEVNHPASGITTFTYDNLGNVLTKQTANLKKEGKTINYEYDYGRLTAINYPDHPENNVKYQLDNVRDINYRTEGTAGENDKVNNGHRYTYDANGNLVYINTSRVKKDGKEDEKATEQKFKWDEENRLLAADENGFVSNYWYDADGERTVKTSGEGEQIYVNSEFAGGHTNTAKFSLYVSPYLVANQGGRYTKHIYIGSQRIVSKLGDFASYGSDPRRIPYAGSEADAVSVDYKGKYASQQQVIKDNYATFNVPYNGEDNNDYVDGEGFCCNDGTPEAAQAKAMAVNVVGAKAVSGNFKENDEYEKMQFYYHPDHLGSSSYITNLDGEVAQHIEYVPFGEVFIEERNNTWNTPYLFNAKELDEETGLYYYGARYMDPKISMWLGVDPLMEQTPSWTPYRAFYCNPIRYTDLIGLSESTHTDDNGNVIAVFNDNDNGVYKHGKNADGSNPTEYQLSKRAEKFGTSSGGIRMGETEHWDEFVSPETGKALTNHRIQFGKSFDPIIAKMHGLAEDMDLAEIASKSAGGQLFDIKKDYAGVGGLLNGKYATSRSAGNFLAGYNAEGGTYFGVGISFKTFQKLAGALHIEESNGKRLSKWQMADIVIRGTYNSSDIKKFVAPTYGEVNYQYRMSLAGWNFGKKKK